MAHDLSDARSLGHAKLESVDPCVAGRCEHKFVAQLALKHVRVIHHVAVIAKNRCLKDIHLGIGQVPNALGVGKVFVHLAHELALVVKQKGLRTVEQRQVKVVEHLDHAGKLANSKMRVHLTIDQLAVCVDLRAV